jgi:Zn-dependent peptidase ImmA (M78 family)
VVLINGSLPGDRYRFTLAHETAHLTLHHHLAWPGENIENEANAFASELLMPAKDIRNFLNRPTLAKLATLKPYWKVSIQALLMRASQLSLINDRQKRYLWAQISGAGYRTTEPLPLQPEEPSLIHELVDCHLNDLGYDEASMGRLLHLELKEFRSQYRDTSAPLRLVK